MAQPAVAQREPSSFVLQQRIVQEQLRAEFDAEVGEAQRALFDWGGWYSSHLFLFDDGVESSRTLRRYDLRLWGRLSLQQGAHDFYARGLFGLLDFNSGESFDGNDDDRAGPSLERGMYRFDLAKALQAYDGRSVDYNLQIAAGRDLVQFGTGLALATRLDHVAVRGTYRYVQLTGLAGRTVGSDPEVDLSRTATRTRRDFLGAELAYIGLERHRPFVYAFSQRDQNRELRFSPFQRFDYDSNYFGIGSTGELIKNLRYSTEWVYETGRSFGDRRFLKSNDIRAWAFDAQLEYLFPGESRTRATLQYLFGSGDGGRRASPTSSIGGNAGDFEDTGFVGFGYRDTGLSFAPLVSNLHMWRAGAAFRPWPDGEALKDLELGTDWFLYHKHHRDGAVSDPTANVQSGYLGWEMDYYLNWRMAVDFAWTTRFGLFFPGTAFSDRTTRTFFLVGFTWSF